VSESSSTRPRYGDPELTPNEELLKRSRELVFGMIDADESLRKSLKTTVEVGDGRLTAEKIAEAFGTDYYLYLTHPSEGSIPLTPERAKELRNDADPLCQRCDGLGRHWAFTISKRWEEVLCNCTISYMSPLRAEHV
jgi:hypothetical protein